MLVDEENFEIKNEITYKDLKKKVFSYIKDKKQRELIKQAYRFARNKHKGQKRKSGEEYIIHPINVAYILACFKMDYATICAGLLHDVLEDTNTTIEELDRIFGTEIGVLVYGVTNFGKEDFLFEDNPREAQDKANIRKLVAGATRDVRILLIKLADRLHNMRTIGFMPKEKQELKAIETLDFYVPIAKYTGVYSSIKKELEDISFKVLDPNEYNRVKSLLEVLNDECYDDVDKTAKEMRRILNENGIVSNVRVRIKSVYSMYKQLEAKKDCGGLLAIDDVFAIKLIVKNSKKQDEAQVCSDAQKVLKNHFPFEIEGEKDYISNPKSNGYKSLHNVITGSDGIKIHLQIRTKNMDYYSKRGIFAVWSLNKDESKRIKLQQRLIRELSFLREFENLIQEYGDDQSTEANKEFVNKCIVRVLSKKNP